MRFLLVVLMVLGSLGVQLPAKATSPVCDRIEPVFGLTRAGDLVEHDYCVGNPVSGFLSPRTIATFPLTGLPRLFWGGMLRGNAAVIYGVTRDGDLWWARQDVWQGEIGPQIVVGRGYGDWNRYQSLVSNGQGSLFGLDPRGHLIQWLHLGWRDGSDTWGAGPQDLGPGCKLGPMAFATVELSFIYVAVQDDPPGYAFCSADGGVRTASELPSDVVTRSVTMAPAPGITYALTVREHRLARLGLHTPQTMRPRWLVDTSAETSYLRVFTGPAFVLGSDRPLYKYEWQWPFYDGTYDERG